MRDTTAQQDADNQALAYAVFVKVEVENADGTYIELTDDPVDGFDYLVSASIEEDVDRPVIQATVNFVRDREGDRSLSPTREDSPLNVDDVAAYAPLLDPGRGMRINVAVIAAGATPITADYQELFDGTIDSVDWAKDETVVVVARDAIGALLADRFAEARTSYGTEAGRPLQNVIQDILDDWAPGITLLVVGTPNFDIPSYTLDGVSVLQAIMTLAALRGWVVRVRWDNGGSNWRLVLEEPDRSASVPDHTFGAEDYFEFQALNIKSFPIRNVIDVIQGGVILATATDATSVARFGRKYMRITEDIDSPIDTIGEGQTLADAVLADLKDPDITQSVDGRLFWPAQVRDLYRYSANASTYDVDQDLAVFGYRHVLESGGGSTILSVRGKPAGHYRYWQKVGRNREPGDATVTETLWSDSEPQFSVERGVDAGFSGYEIDINFDLGPDAASWYVTWEWDDGAPQSGDTHVIAAARGAKGVYTIPQFFRDTYTDVRVTFTPKLTDIQDLTKEPQPGGKRSTFTKSGSGGGVSTLNDLGDVTITGVATGDYLRYDGAAFVNVVGVAGGDITGTITGATWGGTTIAVGFGGTGRTTMNGEGRLLVSTSSSSLTTLAASTAGGYVRSNGSTWVRVTGVAAADITGTLGAGFGGTGRASLTTGSALIGNGTGAVTMVVASVSGNFLRATGSAWASSAILSGDLPSHVHDATDITTGTLVVTRGGTGFSNVTGTGRLLQTSSASSFNLLDSGATNGYLRSDGSNWLRVTGLAAADVTGQLSVSVGGTGRVSLTTGSVLLGNGTGAVTMLVATVSGNYLRANGSTWTSSALLVGDLPSHTHAASDVTTGVFGAGDFRFPSDLNINGRLAVGTSAIPPNLTGGDILANAGVFATSDAGSGNIDHFWHDDAGNIWHFASDTTRKATGNGDVGNSRIRVGLGSVGSCAFQVGDLNSGIYAPIAGQVAVAIKGIQRGLWTGSGLDVTGYVQATGDIVSNIP